MGGVGEGECGVEEGEGGVVDWSGRALRTLPPSLHPMARVHHLYLQDNQLESLPLHLFPSLPLLEWVDLRYNRLAGLPPLQGHPRLRTLLASHNRLAALPADLPSAPLLATLHLAGNHLPQVTHT